MIFVHKSISQESQDRHLFYPGNNNYKPIDYRLRIVGRGLLAQLVMVLTANPGTGCWV